MTPRVRRKTCSSFSSCAPFLGRLIQVFWDTTRRSHALALALRRHRNRSPCALVSSPYNVLANCERYQRIYRTPFAEACERGTLCAVVVRNNSIKYIPSPMNTHDVVHPAPISRAQQRPPPVEALVSSHLLEEEITGSPARN